MLFNKEKKLNAELQLKISLLQEENEGLKDQAKLQQQQVDSLLSDKAAAVNPLLVKNIFQNMGSLSGFVSEIQVSMLGVAGVLEEERSRITEVSKVSSESRDSMGEIVGSLSSMAGDTTTTAKTVDGLNQRAEEIGGIINLIKNISDQTNLLALNAAIEAARAGEHGRGFAVVADEVRTLAKRTGDATNEIESLVTSIQAETVKARNQIEKVADDAQDFSETGVKASKQMDQLLAASNSMEEAINGSAIKSFLEVVKIDHLLWKLDVYKVFMGLSDKASSEFSDHTTCRLGKWYYQGDGQQSFSKLSGYRDIEKPHKEVHQYGLDALKKLDSGDIVEALTNLEKMENQSMEVLRVLSGLIKE